MKTNKSMHLNIYTCAVSGVARILGLEGHAGLKSVGVCIHKLRP